MLCLVMDVNDKFFDLTDLGRPLNSSGGYRPASTTLSAVPVPPRLPGPPGPECSPFSAGPSGAVPSHAAGAAPAPEHTGPALRGSAWPGDEWFYVAAEVFAVHGQVL